MVPGEEKVTYVKVDPQKAAEIVSEHIVNGRVVTKYTIGAAE
jgi:NADP-reducing hydrogenase subunit HndB